jgi:hypothetical protein
LSLVIGFGSFFSIAFSATVFFYRDVPDNPPDDMDARRAGRPDHLRYVPTISKTRVLPQAVCDRAGYPTQLKRLGWAEEELASQGKLAASC